MLVDFNILPDDSKIWIYASEKKLKNDQQSSILTSICNYLKNWAAHKEPLIASAIILEDYFIVIALDEGKNEASGCSIDTLQNKIQELEKELSVSLLNRLNVFCRINDEIQCIPSFKLESIVKANTLFYDLTIQRKSDLHSYLKPISEGWCAHLLK